MTGVTLQKTIKRYGDVQVIHGIDLEIEDGEFCVFVGPSGCGKSTLLRTETASSCALSRVNCTL